MHVPQRLNLPVYMYEYQYQLPGIYHSKYNLLHIIPGTYHTCLQAIPLSEVSSGNGPYQLIRLSSPCRFGLSKLARFYSTMPREAPALPSAAGPPAAARPRHALPTRQRKVSSANDQAPTTTSASGGRGNEPSRGRA